MWFIIITVITFHTKSLGGILRGGGGVIPWNPGSGLCVGH